MLIAMTRRAFAVSVVLSFVAGSAARRIRVTAKRNRKTHHVVITPITKETTHARVEPADPVTIRRPLNRGPIKRLVSPPANLTVHTDACTKSTGESLGSMPCEVEIIEPVPSDALQEETYACPRASYRKSVFTVRLLRLTQSAFLTVELGNC